jgi:hypothetical protein
MSVLAGILTSTLGCRRQSDSSAIQPQAQNGTIEYFQAGHGFNGGLSEMVDLSQRAGFDEIRTIDQVAKFASEVPEAVGRWQILNSVNSPRMSDEMIDARRNRAPQRTAPCLVNESQASRP